MLGKRNTDGGHISRSGERAEEGHISRSGAWTEEQESRDEGLV